MKYAYSHFHKINDMNQPCIYGCPSVDCNCGQDLIPLTPLRLRQNGCRFADDTFKCIFLTENVIIAIKISLKYVPKGLINNIPALVQIMAWRWPCNKPLSEPMLVRLPRHILCHNLKLVLRDNQSNPSLRKIRICLPESVLTADDQGCFTNMD